ncbi:MAG: SGNH/GDSL hydrolase family protein [Lewinellaceae bacterium]|nr:SGNH/GDSL hydrolase family protein [Saprospiraceae bacterium]MCB9355660.1 SGNH/GDSL hydrolase family protein [Lewinellaceae bacterium]
MMLTGAVAAGAQTMQTDTSASFRIVVIGSSTAAGTGANPPDSAWVNRYRQWLQTQQTANEVINLALGGYQTWQLLPSNSRAVPARPRPDTARNITRALSLYPDAVIVNLPSNDAAAGYGVDEQMRNFERIVQAADSAGVPIWICTSQPRHFSADKVLSQIVLRKAILDEFGERAIDFWEPVASPAGLIEIPYNSGDGIHLNNEGHRLLFERVRDQGILQTLIERGPRPKPKASPLSRFLKYIRGKFFTPGK